jgi:mono/diheme cytochrome c family protein
MPSFAWQINDEQIAAVATYVRNRWGHPAPAVSSSEVAKLRARLANRLD